jgi:short-subunit dehydrogenase
VDLSKEADRRDLIERVTGTHWAPSLLVNNVGLGDYGELATARWEKLRRIIDLNVTALTHLTHGFLPDLMRAPRGAILNVSSLASLLPIPDTGVYAATKAYVTSLSESLRLELREHGIPVLALCPGPVHTEFGRAAARAGASGETVGPDVFFVGKEEVVRVALQALQRDRARVYPGWKVALLAAGISLLPLAVIRCIMSHRPRRTPENER